MPQLAYEPSLADRSPSNHGCESRGDVSLTVIHLRTNHLLDDWPSPWVKRPLAYHRWSYMRMDPVRSSSQLLKYDEQPLDSTLPRNIAFSGCDWIMELLLAEFGCILRLR